MKRREEEEEEEEVKKRRREIKKKGMETNLDYGFYEIWYRSLVCMIIILHKLRVLLGFHLNPKIMESMVGKTLNSTRKV